MTRRQWLAGVVLGVALVVGAARTVEAQTEVGFYIVPKIGSGTFQDSYRPKYFGDMVGVEWYGMPYGLDATFLVGAFLTPEQQTTLAANADVYVVPPLNDAVGGNPVLNQTRNRLEAQSIPGSWVESTTTNRQLVGRIGRVCLILQRLNGRHNKRMFEAGVGLDSNLTQTLLNQLLDVGASFNLNMGGFSTALTVRQALLLMADQLPAFVLAGETF